MIEKPWRTSSSLGGIPRRYRHLVVLPNCIVVGLMGFAEKFLISSRLEQSHNIPFAYANIPPPPPGDGLHTCARFSDDSD